MITVKKVTRYYTDCGKGFWNRKQAERHETRCKCWSNPIHKTCLTCEFHILSKEVYKGIYSNSCSKGLKFGDSNWNRGINEKHIDVNKNCEEWKDRNKKRIIAIKKEIDFSSML